MNEIFENLNKSIDLLKTAKEDIHSDKWKRCVEHVKEAGSADNPYAVCTAELGQESFKSFAKSDDLSPEELNRLNMRLLKDATDKLSDLMKNSVEPPNMDYDESARPAQPIAKSDVNLLTETLDVLYGEPTMPRQFISGDLL